MTHYISFQFWNKMKYGITLLFSNVKISFHLHTEITINASPEQVWSVLMDTNKYIEWNPFIKSLQSINSSSLPIHLNDDIRLECYKSNPSNQSMTTKTTTTTQSFQAKITQYNPNQMITWTGSLISPILFQGKHSLELQTIVSSEHQVDSTKFIHKERFYGLFVILAKKNLNTVTRSNFIAMNEALKQRVEQIKLHE